MIYIFHIFLPLKKHGVLINALRALLNHAVHGGVDTRQLFLGRIDVYGEGGDEVVLAQFGVFFLAIFEGFLAVEIHVEA